MADERMTGVDLDRLRSFRVLAEELHFTRAAARLHLTQPALSQQVRALERQLGAELVRRDARGCTLTEVGRIVAAEAQRLLAEVDAGAARIRAAAGGFDGRLRLAYTRSARGGRVDALIARFRERYPQVEIVAETAWTAPNVAGLLAGRYDAAFVRPPIEEPSLTCRHVDSEELLLAVPQRHRLAACRRVQRSDIVEEPAVMWPRDNGPGMYDRIIAQVWPHGGFRLAHHEPDDEQLLRAVAGGTVIAAVPAGRARALTMPGVRLRRFAAPVPTVDTALAYQTNSTNPAVHRLAALLA
ncbi:LysR substrate-binding domain-containing protein [Actinoplanes oblitus]|uniref:LysR substrate-binding domain-containing protein n=1 Tax=Actinoplanes oblitus TaxID=3040509 RepID=A0ABY8WES7_9ACTN|nr:LysR substrate-binding domain-containing protein [Actinoplanes oblitus]WIM94993.1 LysR substrate-binding domain-containing protein [Actinoplanes oblitus]